MTALSELTPEILRQVVWESRFGVLVTDPRQPDNPIVHANPAFCALTGYRTDEVIGRNCRFLQHAPHARPGENTTALARLRAALADRQAVVVTLRNYRSDGTAFWNELAVMPVFNAQGELLHFVGQMLDVTARVELQTDLERAHDTLAKRVAARTAELQVATEKSYQEILERRKAERQLRTTERKFRGMFEHAVEGMYQSTPEGHYISVNPALARMYGYMSPDEILGGVGDIAHDIYVDPAMRERFRTLIERDGIVQNLEYQVRRRNGDIIWISENARVVRDARGRVLYYEGTIQDISARKSAEAEAARLEAQLLQSQKMEAIGTLAGGIAHDFNNILGAVIGYTEMTLDDVPADSLAAANLREALVAARRGKSLVQQILTFSRRQDARRETVSLGALVQEVLKLLHATVPANIRLESSIPTGADAVVADAGQIHQVLLNLGNNAIHAMRPAGGTLGIHVETIAPEAGLPRPSPLRPGSYLRIAVRDSGHGMPPEVRARIFEPFFTTKPVGEGTGLGLSVVHGIVSNHGGEITVESTVGAGTTFTVWLPCADPGPGSPDEALHSD